MTTILVDIHLDALKFEYLNHQYVESKVACCGKRGRGVDDLTFDMAGISSRNKRQRLRRYG